jgi:hypothetical protein
MDSQRRNGQPLNGLVQELARNAAALVRSEVSLAKAELREKASRAGAGIGMLVAALVVAIIAVATLTAAAVMGLAEFMPGWLAALIVTAVLVLVAAGLAAMGKRSLAGASPPVPQEAVESVKEDVTWIRNQAKSGMRSHAPEPSSEQPSRSSPTA